MNKFKPNLKNRMAEPEIQYTRVPGRCSLKQIKLFYTLGFLCEVSLFLTAALWKADARLLSMQIVLQACGVVGLLLDLKCLITYLLTGTVLKKYEYASAQLFRRTNAFLWLCSLLDAVLTIVSAFLSYQAADLYAILCLLFCSTAAYLVYRCETGVVYQEIIK
jgi:hypothetical protein